MHSNSYPITLTNTLTQLHNCPHKNPSEPNHEQFPLTWEKKPPSPLNYSNTILKISFQAKNSIQINFKEEQTFWQLYIVYSGVYLQTCTDCDVAYVGQTGRNFLTRYTVHLQLFCTNNYKSSFAHLFDNGHSMELADSVMQAPHISNNGPYLDTLKRFYIFRP